MEGSKNSIKLFVDSATASNVDLNGSRITLYLDPHINTYKKYVRMLSASIYYNFPNLSTEDNNNKMKFTYNGTDYTITFRTGLYSLNSIQETLNEGLVILGLDSLITIKLDDDISTSLITTTVATTHAFSLDTNDADNLLFKDMLGYTGVLNALAITTTLFESTNKAFLNVVDKIYVYCDICGNGSYLNSKNGSQILSIVPLLSPVGGLINYEPLFPVSVECKSTDVNRIMIYLQDQNGRALNTQGESFDILLEIY